MKEYNPSTRRCLSTSNHSFAAVEGLIWRPELTPRLAELRWFGCEMASKITVHGVLCMMETAAGECYLYAAFWLIELFTAAEASKFDSFMTIQLTSLSLKFVFLGVENDKYTMKYSV